MRTAVLGDDGTWLVARPTLGSSSLPRAVPMVSAMSSTMLTHAARVLLRSWQGQLMVLALGAVVLGVIAQAAASWSLLLQVVAVQLAWLLLLCAAIRAAALEHPAINQTLVLHELETMLPMMPRVVSQVICCGAPAATSFVLVAAAARVHPVIALLLVPVALGVAIMSIGPALVAVAAVTHGDRSWVPHASVRALRAAPLAVTGAACVCVLASMLAAAPIALFGLVVLSFGGLFEVVGTGLALASGAPMFGCVSLALLNASEVEEHVTADDVRESTASGAIGGRMARAAAASAWSTGWHEGPSWDVALEPAAAWGTWMQLDDPCRLALQVTWSGSIAPAIAVADADGSWLQAGELGASGSYAEVVREAGPCYVQLVGRDAAAQAVRVTVHVAAIDVGMRTAS